MSTSTINKLFPMLLKGLVLLACLMLLSAPNILAGPLAGLPCNGNFDGDLDVEFLELPTVGESFNIISNTGSDPVEGFFEGKPDNSLFTVNGPVDSTVDLRIDYDGGSGNDVVLTVMSTPEPATLLLLGFGSLGLLRKRTIKHGFWRK